MRVEHAQPKREIPFRHSQSMSAGPAVREKERDREKEIEKERRYLGNILTERACALVHAVHFSHYTSDSINLECLFVSSAILAASGKTSRVYRVVLICRLKLMLLQLHYIRFYAISMLFAKFVHRKYYCAN